MSTDDTTDGDEPAHPYETDESFHPMGKEWEDRMRDELEETEYDADLGMQMARDAQRLVAGEITEDEFYAEYHEDVDEEFEVDERPIFDDMDSMDTADLESEGSMLESLADVDFEADEASRREVMKKMGAGAAFLGYGAVATYDSNNVEEAPDDISGITPPGPDEREHRWGMVIDLERCDGCLACVSGCVNENGTSTGANWMYVFAWEDEDTDQENFLVRPCQHCSNAPCAKVCPVRARHTRSKDGLVLTDYETCIGCRYCQVACPYGVNYFQWGEADVPMDAIDHLDERPSDVRSMDFDERQQTLSDVNDHVYDERGRWVDSRPPQGVMGKCTMCPSRQDGHTERPKGTVACADACDAQGMSAIHFGDLDADIGDDHDRAVRYLERRSAEGNEEQNIRFDAEIDFAIDPEDDPIDAPDNAYTLSLVERRVGADDFREVDSHGVVVSTNSIEPSSDFEDSSIDAIGGAAPGADDIPPLIYTDEDTAVDLTLVFGSSSFDDVDERDIPIELRLVGAGDDVTLTTAEITLSEADHQVGRTLQRTVTLEIDADDIEVDEDDRYALYFLVEEEDDDEGAVLRSADQSIVFVSDERARSQAAGTPYQSSGLTGELSVPPGVLFKDQATEIGASVEYPSSPSTREKRLVLLRGGEEVETIAETEYEFTQEDTTNTRWGGKQSSFRLLEDLGTDPSIIYLGNEPGSKSEQKEDPDTGISYDMIDSAYANRWDEYMNIIDKRKEHLDYGAGAVSRARGD